MSYVPSQSFAQQNHVKVSKDKVKPTQKSNKAMEPIAKPRLYFQSDNGLTIAQGLIRKERYGEAITIFQSVLKRNPRNIDAVAGTGAAYLGLDQIKPAGNHIRKALARDNKHIGANYLLGLYYLRTDQLPKAVEQAQVLYLLCARYGCPEQNALEGAISRAKKQ